MLLQLASYDQHSYASYSFQIDAATTAATEGIPAWLIKAMGQWSVMHTRRIYSVQPAHFKLYCVYSPEVMLPNSHHGTLILTKL